MTHHRDQTPLLIRPRTSARLLALVLGSHSAALAGVLALPDHWPWMAVPILASLAYQVQVHCLRLAPWAIRSVLWQADGGWEIEFVSGRTVSARLSPATFVSVPLVVLNLTGEGLARWSLPIFSDALDADTLRRLRQRLRLSGTQTSPDPSAPA